NFVCIGKILLNDIKTYIFQIDCEFFISLIRYICLVKGSLLIVSMRYLYLMLYGKGSAAYCFTGFILHIIIKIVKLLRIGNNRFKDAVFGCYQVSLHIKVNVV